MKRNLIVICYAICLLTGCTTSEPTLREQYFQSSSGVSYDWQQIITDNAFYGCGDVNHPCHPISNIK